MRRLAIGWTVVLGFQLSSALFAAEEESQCRVFSDDHMQGQSQNLILDDFEGHASAVMSLWPQGAKSLWVREGYALETYEQEKFQGRVTTWSPSSDDSRYRKSDGGFYVNLYEFTPVTKVVSYRCRKSGQLLSRLGVSPYVSLHAYADMRFSWVSGGNHPNHKWLEITEREGVRTLLVHEDNTYGINQTDYALDLDQGFISVTMNRDAGLRQDEKFAQPVHDTPIAERLAYLGALWQMADAVTTIGKGIDLGYVVLPPKPELKEVDAFLRDLISQVTR